MHSPGHVLGRSHGNNPVDISLDARVGPTSRSGPVRYRASGIVFGPRYSTRIALVTPPPPHQPGPTPCTGVTYPLEMSWGQGTPGGEPPFPTTGPPLTIGTPCPWPGYDKVARLWRVFLPSSIIAAQWRVPHRSPTVQLRSFFILFPNAWFCLSHTHNNQSTIGPAECG